MAPVNSLLSGRRLAGNAIWNFIGMAAPMLVGILVIPLLIDGMGKERFGLLTIVWMGVGYFSLVDLGLGRALTKLVAERLGSGTADDFGPVIWTALFLMMGLGLTAAVAVGLGAGPLVTHVLNVEPEFQGEASTALTVLACGLPAVVVTTALIGILQAHQKFATITAIRIPLGFVTFLGPLTTLQYSPSLVWATAAMLVARVLALVVYFMAARMVRPELNVPNWPGRAQFGPLFRFGGWLTVTNIVGPLMVYFDRFFVGAAISMTAVAYYVTPYEVISRVGILRQAITGVLFPALSTAISVDRGRLVAIYGQASRTLVLLMLPVVAGFFLLAPEALELWLGPDFRDAATPVVQWLSLGMLINTSAQAPVTVLQSTGRPDLVAKVHLLELLPYASLLWLLTVSYGIVGTAFTWFLRVLIDTLVLNGLVRVHVPELSGVVKSNLLGVVAILAGFGFAWTLEPLGLRMMVLAAVAVTVAMSLWTTIRSYVPNRFLVR